MTLLRTSIALFLLAACGPAASQLPDGGRARNVCAPGSNSIAVKVVDPSGAPVQGATVTATSLASGKQLSATTSAEGTTNALTDEIGAGSVSVRASLGTRVSASQQVNWTCGECLCSAQPSSVVLTLSN